MSEVIFEEESDVIVRPNSTPKTSFITRMVFKMGLAKTEEGANYVMLVVAAICAALAIGVLYISGTFGTTEPTPANFTPIGATQPGGQPAP